MRYPNLIQHDTNDLYCELDSHGVNLGLSIFGSVIVAITVCMQILTALALRRIWRTAERSKETTAASISILYRLAGYTIIQVMYLVYVSFPWTTVSGKLTRLSALRRSRMYTQNAWSSSMTSSKPAVCRLHSHC
jgi:hypothetical protein